MFEIKSINELLYPTVTSYGSIKNKFRFVETHRYIDAANSEIKRLQSQPATFDDVPWEPVTYDALVRADDGLYQFKHSDGDVKLWMRGEALWVTTCFRARDDNEMQNWYKTFRKLPIALYTPAPEKPKRYELKETPDGIRLYDSKTDCFAYSLKDLCDKLNRLEKLEAKDENK